MVPRQQRPFRPAHHMERRRVLVPGEKPQVDIAKVYGRAHAVKVVKAAMDDYVDTFAR